MITIRRDKEGRIAVRSPIQFKDALSAAPGARWDRATSSWTYPWTAKALGSIREALDEVWDIVNMSPKITDLLKETDRLLEHTDSVRASIEGLPPIPITVFPPWDHQFQAYHFAKELPGCLLNMAVGTGKSKVTIDLMMNRGTKANLIFAPKKVVDNVWEKQLNDHWSAEAGGLNYIIQVGDARRLQRRVAELMEADETFVAITTYETGWRAPFADWAIQQQWGQVTLDEIHRAKAPGGKTSMFFSKLSAHAQWRLGLSGTPIPNGLQDAYGIYRFLDPGVFGTNFQKFGRRYLEYGGFNNYQIVAYHNEAEWNRKFYSIAFRVDDDVLDLPVAREVTYKCEQSAEARPVYKELKKEFVSFVKGRAVSAKNALAKMTRLQQISSGFVQLDEDKRRVAFEENPKIDLLRDVLADMARDEPIIIFYRFTQDADNLLALMERLGRSVGEVSGRADEIKDWQAGEKDVLIVQVQSGSEGNDLTRARYGIYYSMTFSYRDLVQSQGRIRRPGQKRQPMFIRLAVAGTIDVDIWNALDNKTDVIDWVLKGINDGD